MKFYKRIIVKICLLLISLTFSLIIGELFLRLPIFGSKYSLGNFAVEDPRQITLNENYHVFRPSAILGYEHIPNSVPAGERAIIAPPINSYGMVGKEYRLKKKKNTFRILVLGDSITEFNWYVEDLEQKLNSDPKLRYNFEIWNGGVCGYEVNQYLNYLRYKGIKYNPDMAIIGLCLNDFSSDSMVIFYKDSKGFTQYYYPTPYLERIIPPNRFLFKHLYLYRFLIVKLETLLSQMHQKEKDGDMRIRTGLYFLGEIKHICHNRKIPLFCVIFPYLKPTSEYDSSQKDDYNSMLRVLKELNIDYLDLHLYFSETKRYELRNNKSDYIHPSSEGHEIAATAIYKHLIKNYFGD